METLVSQVDLTVSSTLGHSIRFQAGVPRPVPPVLVTAALQAGARPATDSSPQTQGTGGGPSPKQIAQVMRQLIEEGDPDKLTQQGKVRVDAIEEVLGEDITTACRREAEKLIESGEV